MSLVEAPRPTNAVRTARRKLARDELYAELGVLEARTKPPNSLYDTVTGDRICDLIAGGHSLKQACALVKNNVQGKPITNVVALGWVAAYPAFASKYHAARISQAHYWADEIVVIADDSEGDHVTRTRPDGSEYEAVDADHIARSRLRVDTRKWLLSKVLPKVYGDRLLLGGDPDAPLVVADDSGKRELAKSLLLVLGSLNVQVNEAVPALPAPAPRKKKGPAPK